MINLTNKYQDRVDELIKSMNVDAIIITDPTNIFYFTGCFIIPHERVFTLVVNTNNKNTSLIYPELDEVTVNNTATITHGLPYPDGVDAFKLIFDQLPNTQSIAIEGSHLTYDRYMRILENYLPYQVYRVDDNVNHLRAIKDDDDKKNLQEAVDIAEKGLYDLKKTNVIGKSEKEIKEFLTIKVKEYGAEDISFGPLVLTGENSALPHGESGDTIIKEGDFLLVDFGVITENHYMSDMTRTFIIGEPTEEQKDIYETVLEANIKGIEASAAGTEMKDLDKAARTVIENANYGEFFTHRIGHGLGISIHEQPSLDNQNTDTLKAGHVFTIEPGIYKAGFGGVRIEDSLYVEENTPPYVFNTFPKDIESMILRK